MKIIRLLLIALLSFSSFVLLAGSNVMQINDAQGDAGDPITIEVEITNEDVFVGFQFDVPLPTGFTYQTSSLVLFRAAGHMGQASVLPGNILRVLAFSFVNAPFSGNSGVVCTFVLNTPSTVGSFPMHLQGVSIGNALGQNICTGTIDGTVTLLGEAVGYDVTLGVAPPGAGTVSGAGEYYPGDAVSVSATPAAGYLFVNWTDGDGVVSTANPYNFTMPAEDVALTANFATIPTYTLTLNVSPAGAGSTTGAGAYAAGAPVTATASAGTGYYFVSWTEDGGIVSLDNPYNFTMPAENLTLVANFSAIPTYNVTATVDPAGSGSVLGAGVYEEGDLVTMMAIANPGYQFVNWTDEMDVVVSASNPYNFTMPDEDVVLVANFMEVEETFAVTFNVNMTGAAGFNPATDDVYLSGTFNGWTIPPVDPEYEMVEVSPWNYQLTLQLSVGTYQYKYYYMDGATPVAEPIAVNRVAVVADDLIINDEWGLLSNIAILHDAEVFVDAPDITVDLEIVNSSVFVAFQFVIQLPAGFTYQPGSIAFSGRQADHTINAAVLPGNQLQILATSLTQSPFMGNSGNVCSFVLDFTAGAGAYPLNFTQAIISDALANNVLSDVDNGVLTIKPHSNVLIINDEEVLTGNPMTVELAIDNTQQFVAFQLDVQLPAGFTYVSASILLVPGRKVDHTISATVMAGNKLRILSSSLTNSYFLGNEGPVATFVLNTPANPGPGDDEYPCPIVAPYFISNFDGEDICTGTDPGVLTILAHQNILEVVDFNGLCNRDQTFQVAITNSQQFAGFQLDVVMPAGFTYVTGTVALDPARKAADHVIYANVLAGNILRILSTSPTNALFQGNSGTVATFVLHTASIPGTCPMYVNEVENAHISSALGAELLTGTEDGCITIANQNLFIIHDASQLVNHPVTIEVEIDNTQDFVAFQADIAIPSGFSYVNGSVALDPDRIVDHTIFANVLPGNILRVIASSLTNEEFLGFNGTIFTFVLNTPGLPGPYNLNFSSTAPYNVIIISSPAPPVNLLTGTDNGVITLLPDVNCPDDFAVCIDEEPWTLYGGTPEGGVYTGPGVSDNMFYPAMAGVGVHVITYTYTYPNLISGSCTFEITVNPLPVVTCPANFSVCLEAEPWMLYGGTPTGGVYSGTGVSSGMFDPEVAGPGDHVITYTYTDENTCVNFCTFTIHVYELFEASIAEDQIICYDSVPEVLTSTVTGGAGNYTYQWWTWDEAPVEEIEDATEATYQPGALQETTSYVLQVFDDCGMIITDPVTITVYDQFLASIAEDQTICYNTVPELLTSTISGGQGNYTYQWWTYEDGPVAPIEGADEATFQPPALMETTSYVLQVFDYCGMIITDPVTITVYDEFLASIAVDQTICYNTVPDLLTSTVTGGQGNYTYQWWTYDDGPVAPIEGAIEATYQPPALMETTSYVLQVFDYCGMIITDPVTITVYDEFLASIAANQTICYNTAPELLTSTVSGGAGVYTYQWWTYNDGPVAPIEGATDPTYQPPALTVTTSYVLQVFDDPCGMIITDPVTITVYAELLSSIAANQSICYNTAPQLLTSTTTGGNGEYLYHWASSSDGIEFTPIEGAHAATYQPPALMETTYYMLNVDDTFGCGPITTNIVTITVFDPLAVTIAANQEICNATQPAPLTSVATGGDGAYTYQWQSSVDQTVWTNIQGATSATYQPGILIGTTYYRLIVNDGHNCGPVTSNTVTIIVYDVLAGTIAADQVICYNTAPALLTSNITGGKGNYTYHWQKFIEGEQEFNVEHEYTFPNLTDPYAYEVNSWTEIGWSAANVPAGEDIIIQDFEITATQLCTDYWYGEVALFVKSPAGTTVQIWQGVSNNGCTNNFVFATNAFDGQHSQGQWQIYFTDSYGDGGGTAFGLKITVGYTYTISGTWMDITGATAATYQPPVLTDTTMYRLHVNDFCGEIFTDEVTISVTPLPTANAGEDDGFCENQTYTLNGTATNYGSVVWTTAGDGTFNDAGLLNAAYTPGDADIAAGDVTLTLTAHALNECPDIATDQVTLEIGLLPTVNAGDDGAACEDGYFVTLGFTTNAWTTLWTTSGDGYFEDPTSTFTKYWPGDGDLATGQAILTLTATAVPPCTTPVSDQVVVTFIQKPTASAGADATICGTGTHTLSGAATNFATITWSTSGDGTFSNTHILNPVYTPGVNDITNGTAILTLTATAIAPCEGNATDAMTLTIIGLPQAFAGADAAVCAGNAYVLTGATASHYGSLVWTTSGSGTFTNPNVVNATYNPSPGDIADGTVVLTLTAYAVPPCGGLATDAMVLTITTPPTAFAGDDFSVCSNQTVVLDGTADNYASVKWTTAGDGTFSNANILDPVYTPGTLDYLAGSVQLTLTAYAEAPCGEDAVDMVVVTIVPSAFANAGPDDKICANELYQLSGVAGGYFYTEWTSSGDGKFNDNTLLNATYEPGATDILLGYANLTLTSWPIAPCTTPASDMMVLLIDPMPALPGIPTGSDTVCVLTSDTTWYSTIGAENALSYVWDIFPAEAGTISGEGTVGVVDWSGEYFGPIFIKVKGVNDCGEGDFSESFVVLADPCPGVPGQPSAELTVLVYPNPSDAKFNLKITNITGKLDMSLMDITGQILRQESVNSVNGLYKTEIDISTYPKGIYFLRLQGDNISKVERLILR